MSKKKCLLMSLLFLLIFAGSGLAIVDKSKTKEDLLKAKKEKLPAEIKKLLSEQKFPETVVQRIISEYTDYVPDEIIVKFKPDVSKSKADKVAKEENASVKRKLKLRNQNVYLLKLPKNTDVKKLIKKLQKRSDVVYAERNAYFHIMDQLIPNDPNFAQQWALNNTGQSYPIGGGSSTSGTVDADIDAPEGWYDVNDTFGRIGDPNIVIAILDTGVDFNHPDLDGVVGTGDYAGYDFVNDDNDPSDDHGHGTHCAGIAAAIGNNNDDVIGVAAGCTIMPIKIFDANGYSTSDIIAEGIDYAADPNHKANVFSMSFGGPYSETVEDAIKNAHDSGCILVAAAGNEYANLDYYFTYPACYSEVITVAATDSDDQKPSFSNYGEKIDVAAPGVYILSLRAAGTDMYDDGGSRFIPYGDPNATMYVCSGTSMACPHVAGLAAFCLSFDPNLTNEEVRWLIRNSSDDIEDPNNSSDDNYFGSGRINVYKSVYGATNLPEKATEPFPIEDSTGVNGKVDLIWRPGSGTISHDIFFGTDFNDVNDANTSSDEFKGNQYDNVFDQNVLDANTTYYWRIDEKNKQGTTKGDVWNFTTGSCMGIIYVDVNADPNGNNDGSSWTNAFTKIQDAFNTAYYGDQIWVAKGTYKPTDGNDRFTSFELIEGVELYGGFDGDENSLEQRDWQNNETILSGDIGITNDSNDNSYSVVMGADDSILDGFIITNGKAYYYPDDHGTCGGGMLNLFVDSQKIKNCKFINNYAYSSGGGIYFFNCSSSQVENCIFQNNVSSQFGGGGIYFENSPGTVNNSKFINNQALEPGGGICCLVFSDVKINNCLICDNEVVNSGGGLSISYYSDVTVENCTFSRNSSQYNGGGIYITQGGSAYITNSIFWANIANTGEEYCNQSATVFGFPESDVTFSYCDLDGGINGDKFNGVEAMDGGGNINSDPCFVDANSNDFHLCPSSPCIDAGDPNEPTDSNYYNPYESGQTDFEGDPRVMRQSTDIGADEVRGVHNINKDTWYTTIQSAIDDASAGNVIELSEGTYKENIDFKNRSVTLRSSDPNDWDVVQSTKVIADSSGYSVFYLISGEDSNSVLMGLTISGGFSGIICDNNSTPLITKCIIEKNQTYGGIAIGSAATITNNIIRNNRRYGIYSLSDAASIKNNLMYGNGIGLRLYYCSSNVDINNNTVFGCKEQGIQVLSGTSPTVTNSIIWSTSDDLYGASATYSCIEDGDAGTGNISSDPCFVNVFDFADRTNGAGTQITIKVADASIYEVNDIIEYDNDGVPRKVTALNTSTDIITFAADALEANSVTNKMIYNWGPDVTDVNEDLHIKSTSPCVEAGNPNKTGDNEVDIDGDSRVIYQSVDIGADEAILPVHNISKDKGYITIQSAINDANDANTIVVSEGTYHESIDFNGKAITLRSTDPNDWNVVESTIIDFPLCFADNEDNNTVLAGIKFTSYIAGIFDSSPTITQCIIENTGTSAIDLEYNSSPLITRNIIRNCEEGINCWGNAQPTIINNLIYDINSHAIYFCDNDLAAIVRNNTIFNCQYGIKVTQEGTAPTISNCIIWYCDDDLYNCNATYSCIEDGDSGTGNISSNPCFKDAGNGNYHLEYNSPCIDTGDPNTMGTNEFDIDGDPRVINDVVDMGGDEYDPD